MRLSAVQSGIETVSLRWPLAAQALLRRLRERGVSVAIALGAAVLCGVQTLSLKAGPSFADGAGYLCYSLTLFTCMAGSLAFARGDHGTIRRRWLFLAGAQAAIAIYFIFPVLQYLGLLNVEASRVAGQSSNALGNALLLLAATMWFAGATRLMVGLDMLQALLAGVLQFAVIFAPRTHDFFSVNHLAVSTSIKLFLFLTALTASAGSASAAENRFLRLLSLFLGLQAFGSFLMNQVGYVWLHHRLASVWDVPQTVFNLSFLYVAVQTMYFSRARLYDVQPTLFVRNLMPSFLALGNVGLGLLILARYKVLGMAAILLAVVCYMLRTVMLQGQAAQERESLHRLNLHLEELAARDTLTGIGNRRSLVSALARLSRSQHYKTFALLLVDTDEFKQANDRFGHLYGDEVLIAISDVLQSASDAVPNSHCARFGGDEFALLLPGIDAEAAHRLGDELRLRVRALALGDEARPISISLGLTVSELSEQLSFERVVRLADEALYRAKSLGRDRVEMSEEISLT